MQFSISDSMVSEFLSGIFAILALVAVGGILSLILRRMTSQYPFSRLAIVLALAPISLISFIDRNGSSTLYLYAMIVILLGITIDGIAYLLEPKHLTKEDVEAEMEGIETENVEEDPSVIVWEKAE